MGSRSFSQFFYGIENNYRQKIYAFLLDFLWGCVILNATKRKEAAAMILYETQKHDVDDMIYENTHTVPSER